MARVCGRHADRLERMVYTSSSGVFPNNGETIACAYHPVDERHPKRPMGEYSLGKLIGEEFTKMAARETGLRYSIVRPSHVQSGEAILSRFTVGAVAGLLERGQNTPLGELYMADGTELWHDVLAQAETRASRAACAIWMGGRGSISRTMRATSRICWCALWRSRAR